MERQIKFRGKKLRTNEWKYGSGISGNSDDDKICLIISDEDGFSSTRIEPYTETQYIGLKDKNDKEIYEGDIIRVDYRYEATDMDGIKIPDLHCLCEGLVIYMTEYACFGLRLIKAQMPLKVRLKQAKYVNTPLMNYILSSDSIEVLGNWKDNPELLEQEP